MTLWPHCAMAPPRATMNHERRDRCIIVALSSLPWGLEGKDKGRDSMLVSRRAWKSGTLLCGCAQRYSLTRLRAQSMPRCLTAVGTTYCQRHFASSDESQRSNRAAFKVTPVDPKLLDYIERIGVGIPKRMSSKSRQQAPRRKKYSRKHDTTVLTTEEELDFFRQRTRNISKERRAKKKRASGDGVRLSSSSSWLPPPPFASSSPAQQQGA